MKRWLVVPMTIFAVGCVDEAPDQPQEAEIVPGQLALMVDVAGAQKVVAADLAIRRCERAEAVHNESRPVADWADKLVSPAYEKQSGRQLLAQTLPLDQGCYDVDVTIHDQSSQRCSVARAREVTIEAGARREVLLYARCAEGQRPAPPPVEMISYEGSHQVLCQEQARVCATVGGLEALAWSPADGAMEKRPMKAGDVWSVGPGKRRVRHCAQWRPDKAGLSVGVARVNDQAANFPLEYVCEESGERDNAKSPRRHWPLKDGKLPKKWPRPPGLDKLLKEGDLAVVAAMNEAPTIRQVVAKPGKFLGCQAQVTLCAEARDGDGDPLRYRWQQIAGPEAIEGPTPVAAKSADQQCVRFDLASATATYAFELTVFDQFRNGQGQLLDAEQWYAQQMGHAIASRDSLTLPVYVSCPGDGANSD